jgi:hypothetical protein
MQLRSLVLLGLITLASVALFDLAAYHLLPKTLDARIPGYRQAASGDDLIIGGRGSYPKDYFVPNASRGFDIGAGRKARHYVQELGFYHIWGNELGCFDRPLTRSELDKGFVYLAGDSFTWGYVPFEQHFGSLLEQRIEQRVLKCGVTHTGQLHQFEKFKEILAGIGRDPQLVIVNYYANDIANDFAHPYATVIDGWQVDNVGLLPPDKLLRIDRETLKSRIGEKLHAHAGNAGSVQDWLRRYSVSFQVLLKLTGKQKPKKKQDKGVKYRSIYDLYAESGVSPFLLPKAERNREALLEWHAHADSTGYPLLLALIPPAAEAKNTDYYADLRAFLRNNEIEYADFTEYLRDRGAKHVSELFWPSNRHLNIAGNLEYATFLSKAVQRTLTGTALRNRDDVDDSKP